MPETIIKIKNIVVIHSTKFTYSSAWLTISRATQKNHQTTILGNSTHLNRRTKSWVDALKRAFVNLFYPKLFLYKETYKTQHRNETKQKTPSCMHIKRSARIAACDICLLALLFSLYMNKNNFQSYYLLLTEENSWKKYIETRNF